MLPSAPRASRVETVHNQGHVSFEEGVGVCTGGFFWSWPVTQFYADHTAWTSTSASLVAFFSSLNQLPKSNLTLCSPKLFCVQPWLQSPVTCKLRIFQKGNKGYLEIGYPNRIRYPKKATILLSHKKPASYLTWRMAQLYSPAGNLHSTTLLLHFYYSFQTFYQTRKENTFPRSLSNLNFYKYYKSSLSKNSIISQISTHKSARKLFDFLEFSCASLEGRSFIKSFWTDKRTSAWYSSLFFPC